MPKTSNHTEIMSYLTKLDERQITIFKRIDKIENYLAKINGKVQDQEIKVAEIRTYGTMAVLSIPIIVNVITRVFF